VAPLPVDERDILGADGNNAPRPKRFGGIEGIAGFRRALPSFTHSFRRRTTTGFS